MADPFEDFVKGEGLGEAPSPPPMSSLPTSEPSSLAPVPATSSTGTDPFAEVASEAAKPLPGDPSIFNALPRGLNGVRQGSNLSWFAAQRLMGQAPDPTSVLDSIGAGEEFDKLYPKTEAELDAERRFFKEGNWSELLNPKFIAGAALESLPSMVGPLIGGIGGGLAGSSAGPVGTAAGAMLGGGAGSGIIDYGASYKDYLTKKLGPFDRAKWDTAFRNDPNLLDEAHAWAAKHSSMVAAFDMLGMKIGGKIAAPALRAGSSIGTRAGAVAGGIATEGVTETLGETTGSALASGGSDWNIQEAVLGGVAAAATGGAHSFVEPVVNKIRGTGHAPGNLTDSRIDEVFREFSGQQEPSILPDLGDTSLVATSQTAGPIWRSALRDAVELKGPAFADANQWINTINNMPAVKREEIEQTGIEQFLRGQEGKISKSDVIAELEANQVQISEVEKSGTSEDDPARFPKFQLPNGENYKELLLKLPAKVDGTDFQSSHWPADRNVLAHVRFNERVDHDGQPTLHIEEIQSDWHQKGRQEGYLPKGQTVASLRKAANDAYARFMEMVDATPTIRGDTQITLAQLEIENAREEYQQANAVYLRSLDARIPDAPFKSTWHELSFKRMLRYAADNGFSRITWTPSAEQIKRYTLSTPNGPVGLDAQQQRGMQEFYDKILPSVAKKWAKRLGGKYGETKINLDDGFGLENSIWVPYVDIPPAASGIIQRGLPTFSMGAPDRISASPATKERALTDRNVVERGQDVTELAPALMELRKKFKLDHLPLRVHMTVQNNNRYGALQDDGRGGYVIEVNLTMHKNAPELWATMVHEFGHMVFFEKFALAPTHVQQAIRADYDLFRQSVRPTDTLESLFLRRDAAISAHQRSEMGGGQVRLYQLDPSQQKYWSSFDEWAAEQVVKWATSSVKPITIVEKWFRGMGRYLAEFFRYAKGMFEPRGMYLLPEISVESWLNSFIDDAPELTAMVYPEVDAKTRAANEQALSKEAPYVTPTEQTFATQPALRAINTLFESQVPPSVRAMAAHGDRINKFTEMMISLPQLAKVNTHIRSLQLYKEDIQLWQLEKQRMMDEALTTLKGWRKLRGPKADAVAALIDDMMNMVYLQPNEAARKPTQVEFDAMVRRLGVTDDGLQVFSNIVKDFDNMLTRYQDILTREADKIVDPITRFQKIQDINASIARMRKVPYFPAMRFGDFTVTVRDAAGKVIHFETATTQKAQRNIVKALKPQLAVDDEISTGILPKDARPLLGMPPGLLQMIGDKLALSPTQKGVLEELRFELAPQQSFRHRFQRKRLVAGYSQDFMRAYANYMFHGSNHMARVKYADQLRDHVKDVREQAKFMPDGVARGRIANFMSDHLQNVLDPKPDFAALRGAMFLWALGYSPAAATLNLTQMVLGTYPFLASKFGDVKAMKAMTSAGARVSSFYKRGKISELATQNAGTPYGLEMQALSEAVKEGVISEAMAPELAAVSEGRNLGVGFGGNAAERAWSRFSEGASWMFEMTEQTNRRITFRAAFNLALQNPNAPYIRDVVQQNSRQYDRLRAAGWTEQAASAFVAAKDATETTQYQYNQASQPRFMRGKLRTVFVFKSFVQNTMFFLWNYPAAAVRSMLIMGFLGGLMGIPGSDDLKDLLKVLGWQIFGRNFNLEHEARKLVVELSNGTIDPDILLHGIARKGFGIPAVMSLVSGGLVNLPELDRSRAISMGQLNPVPLSPIFGPPSKDESRGIADSIQKASGAAFGVGFNMIKAITDSQLNATDPKRWEKAMPRFMASTSRMFRSYAEGQERTRGGSTVIKYDTNDPEQMMEVLALGAGYTPTRLAKRWDNILAKQEVEQYWDLRKSGILKQYSDANNGGDIKEIERVEEAIAKFNRDLPKGAEAMRITQKTLDRSVQTRTRIKEKRDAGKPLQTSKEGLYESIDKLFPGAVEVKKVR